MIHTQSMNLFSLTKKDADLASFSFYEYYPEFFCSTAEAHLV